ncbi:MAG: hypothetical protein ACLP0J_30475 [Solirubrobacteraceae bacterium]|jgi:hypothetical protein
MPQRFLHHFRNNIISYLALLFAVGASGGYALAATQTKTIHGCITRSHQLLIQTKCARDEKNLTWNQTGPQGPQGQTGATGTSPFSASGVVGTNGVAFANSQGFAVQPLATGEYQVTLTGAACSVSGGQGDSLVVSPVGTPGDIAPGTSGQYSEYHVADVEGVGGSPGVFNVYIGQVLNGSYAPENVNFDVLGAC